MPVMKSLRAFRLASTTGHVIQVEAMTPVHIPPTIVHEAIASGMIETDESVPGADLEQPDGLSVAPETEAAPEAEPEPEVNHLEHALLRLITRSDEADFKADGYPKVARVNAELPPEADRATATEIADCFDELQSNINLAE